MNVELIHDARKMLRISVVEHPRLIRVLKQLNAETTFSLPGRVFFVVGLPGFGVSTIAKALKSQINKDTQPFNPFQAVEIVAQVPLSGTFNWKQFFEQGLTFLNEPVVGQRMRAVDSPNGITKFSGNAVFRGATKYQDDFSSALQRRMTRTLIVQNAHNMIRGLDEKSLGLPLDVIQQLAQGKGQTPQKVVLSGHPDLLKMFTDNSEHFLHAQTIAVLPYEEKDPDITDFLSLLAGYESMFSRFIEPFCLQNNAKEIYKKTMSGEGWIERSLSDAFVHLELEQLSRLSWANIEKHLPNQKVADRLRKDAQELTAILGDTVSTYTQKSVRLTPANRRSRPFERLPGNDPVGFN